MYKKAGIIVGGLIIIITIVLFVIASNASKQDNNTEDIPTTSTTQTQGTQQTQQTQSPVVAPQTQMTTTVQTTTTQATTTQPPVEETQPVEQTQPVETQPQAPATNGTELIKIDAGSLPTHTDTTDIGTVVGRNVYSYNHQVIYSLMINTTTHGQIEWFTTLTNYNLADGTRLECSIRTFNAQSGAFPSIISVKAI